MSRRFFWFLLGVVGLMVAVGLWGCSSSRSVVSSDVSSDVGRSHDTVYVARTAVEKIVERDTVNRFVRGDSVFVEVIRWRVRDRVRTDTVYASRTDSVAVVRERVSERVTERELSAWERFRLGCFWPLAGLALLAGFAWAWLRWRRRVLV